MPWPSPKAFGIVENPLVFSPFSQNNGPGDGGGIPSNSFLLLDGTPFMLLDGTYFLLLET